MEVVYIAEIQKTYGMILGVVLVLVGILGFVPGITTDGLLLGIFGVNAVENVVHLLGGAAILYFVNKGSAKTTNMYLGYVGLVLAILGFVPGASGLLLSIFGINMAATVLHLAIGVLSLGVAYGVKE